MKLSGFRAALAGSLLAASCAASPVAAADRAEFERIVPGLTGGVAIYCDAVEDARALAGHLANEEIVAAEQLLLPQASSCHIVEGADAGAPVVTARGVEVDQIFEGPRRVLVVVVAEIVAPAEQAGRRIHVFLYAET